jgi:predicted lipase
MCSLDLAIQHPKIPVTHYTFGQPRVGNAAFAQFYNSSSVTAHYRTVHNHDIVPHLPLEAMGISLRHLSHRQIQC